MPDFDASQNELVLSQSEYARLLEEIHKLQARITELTALRDDLVYHVCPALRAEYDEKIVSLERELMAANMYLRELQRTVEILQSQMNQRQKPSMEKARAQAKKENQEFEDDLNRKAEEAREFKQKWEESGWSKHDREERKAREKEKQERSDEGSKGESSKGSDQTNGNSGKNQKETNSDGSDSGNGSDPKAGSEADYKERDDDESGQEETIARKIKRLYRKIVKRLHPDVHENATEHEKDLLNQAMKAFQEGNLEKLERIWEELSGMDAPEDLYEDTPEGRKLLRELLEKLKDRLRQLELEIDQIKMDFPYRLKSFLEDPAAVEEARRELLSKIDHVRDMNRQLEAFINELKEKIRKGKKL